MERICELVDRSNKLAILKQGEKNENYRKELKRTYHDEKCLA